MAIKGVRLITGEDVIFYTQERVEKTDYIKMENPVRIVVQSQADGSQGVAFVPEFPLARNGTVNIPTASLLCEPYALPEDLEQVYAEQFGVVWTPSTTPIITG